ncbi:UNVERIFIED_ORG: hypothetical protein BCL66_11252 [Martelella mediterranea]
MAAFRYESKKCRRDWSNGHKTCISAPNFMNFKDELAVVMPAADQALPKLE